MNRVVIVGNLTRDPEVKALPSGMAVCELGVAVNDRVKKGEEWVDAVSYFDVAVFGTRGENVAKYLAKGSKVGIDGRLRQERWTNDANENRSRVSIVAENVDFLTPKQNGDGPSAQEPPADDFPPAPPPAQNTQDDEIPF